MSNPAFAQINEEVQTQPPLLRVTTGDVSQGARGRKFFRIAGGKKGSLQTAAIMAALVREAAVRDKPLEMFAARILIDNGLDSHSDPYEIADTLLRYCQRLTYIHDPAGSFDSVQSARQVIQEGKGDCDDLSVLLATLLALVGFKPRFVLAKYNAESEGFDHVYVDLELPRGRVALDPTSRKHGIGWESPKAIERVAYPIFDGKVVGLGDLAGKLRSVFQGFSDCGGSCSSGGCARSCGCKAKPKSTVTAGSDIQVGALGGVSLSFPAVLFSMVTVLVTLKALDTFVFRNS